MGGADPSTTKTHYKTSRFPPREVSSYPKALDEPVSMNGGFSC